MKWHELQAWERRAILEEFGSPLPKDLRGMLWDWVEISPGVSALHPVGGNPEEE
jgi:hypothetical protein